MGNWRLTAKQNVISPNRGLINVPTKDLMIGFSFIVSAPLTEEPTLQEVVGALLLEGFSKEEAEQYANNSWRMFFDGVEIGEADYDRANKQLQAQLHRNNYSARQTNAISSAISEPETPTKKSKKKNKKDEDEDNDDDEEELIFKILLAPFRLVWWIIKGIWWIISGIFRILFSALTFGIFDD